jgi:tetratricopeptide (TPR) repeat protein
MFRKRIMTTLLPVLLLMAAGTASGGGGSGPDAKDEMQLGVKAARRGYWQEALTRFERASQKRPDDPEILNNVAVALEAVGRYDEAMATYQRAISLDPGDRNLQRNLLLFNEFYDNYVLRKDELDEPEEGPDAGS